VTRKIEKRQVIPIDLAFSISKIRGIEEVIQTKFKLPNQLRKMYCILENIKTFRINKEYIKSHKAIKKLHNKHLGEKCFIIGMGPSLNLTNFDLIKDEVLFVTNKFFVGKDKFNVNPQYYCVSDIVVFNEFYKQILETDTTLFLPEEAGRLYINKIQHKTVNKTKDTIVIKPLGNFSTWERFSKDLIKGAYGGVVVFSCLQIAYYMGFKEIYLLGCDCDKSHGIHFDELNIPEEEKTLWNETFNTYDLCKEVFEKAGRKIYNSTVVGKLEVFERKKLEDII